MVLTGKLPEEVKNLYVVDDGKYIGDLLTTLSQNGYDAEYITNCSYTISTNYEYGGKIFILLSKPYNSANAVKSLKVEANSKDSDAVEIARYNLQGETISKNDKGIQIIVYSDYTTKTVLVE